MSGSFDRQDNSATPLDEEEKEALVSFVWVATREELNEIEQANILEAKRWATAERRQVLDERFLDDLHKRMLGRVWRWAGTRRRSGETVGIDAYRIPVELRQAIDDCRYWIENEIYPPDEIAARFHHRLVWIHLYPDGNGRHARLVADLLLDSLDRPRFSWGGENLAVAGETRRRYIEALRAADNRDFKPLLAFVRS